MTVCLPFSKIEFLTVNPRTGYILLGFIMLIIIYCYQGFYYLNDIGTGFMGQNANGPGDEVTGPYTIYDIRQLPCGVAAFFSKIRMRFLRREDIYGCEGGCDE